MSHRNYCMFVFKSRNIYITHIIIQNPSLFIYLCFLSFGMSLDIFFIQIRRMTNEEKRKEQRKAEAHRDHPERAVHPDRTIRVNSTLRMIPDRTHRIRIPYGTAVRKLSGTVFLYQTDLSCLRGTRDRGHLYDHLSDRTLCQR